MMESIRADIRFLIAKYGVSAVHTEFQAEMRETYQFLRQLYEPPKNNLIIPVAEVIPDRIATPHHKPMAATVVSIEPPPLELGQDEQPAVSVTLVKNVEEERDPSLKELVIEAKKSMHEQPSEKFSKAKHKEEVGKKHKELLEKGIKPESLLTKENLTKWLGEGMSYMRIAREQAGVPENEIAALAKSFGLQSDIKKYIVMKKTGK
jgi:hypothetical protein